MRPKKFTAKYSPSGEEQDFTVEFNFYPGFPGSFYRRNGDPGDPPEPDEVEILSVKASGTDVTDLYADRLSDDDNFFELAAQMYGESMQPQEE